MRLNKTKILAEGYFSNVEKTDMTDELSSMSGEQKFEFSFIIEKSYILREIRQELIHPSVPADIRDKELFDMLRKDFKRFTALVSDWNIIDNYHILIETYDSSHRYYLNKENPKDYEPQQYFSSELFLEKMSSMKEYDWLNIGFKVLFNAEKSMSMKMFMDDIKKLRSFASTSNLFNKGYTHWLRLLTKSGDEEVTELIEPIYIGHYDHLDIKPYYFIYDCVYGTDYQSDDNGFEKDNTLRYSVIYAKNSKFTRWLIRLDRFHKVRFDEYIVEVDGYIIQGDNVVLIINVQPRQKNTEHKAVTVMRFIYENFIKKMDYEQFRNKTVTVTLFDGEWVEDVKELPYNPVLVAHDDELHSKYYIGFGNHCRKLIKVDANKNTRDEYIHYMDVAVREWNRVIEGKSTI